LSLEREVLSHFLRLIKEREEKREKKREDINQGRFDLEEVV